MSAIEKLEKALAASKKEWSLPEHRSGFPTVKITEITAEAILVKLERLQEGIELAIDYLPECPDKAKNFLEGALRPKPCEICGGSGKKPRPNPTRWEHPKNILCECRKENKDG